MRKFFISLFFCASFTLFILFLCTPDTVQRAAYESLLFCVAVLIPSLFPGFVLSDLLIRTFPFSRRSKNSIFQRIFQLPSACFRCWLIGLLAGFPAATDCVCYLVRSGEITKHEAERCLAFTNNPGIVFVIGAVGSGLFGSFSVGLYLWGIQTLSAVLIAFLFTVPYEATLLKEKPASAPIKLKESFPKAITSSVSAILNICGFVVFFRVLIAVLTEAVPLTVFKIVLSGLLEMTCGISCFSEFNLQATVFVSLILGWSGFSVHFQILNITEREGLSIKYYFPGKVLQSFISAAITYMTYALFFDDSAVTSYVALCVPFLFLTVFILRFRKGCRHGKRNLPTRKTAS